MSKYQEAASNIYQECKSIIGQAAVGIARRNKNTTLNEENEIEIFEGEEEELKEFIEDYVDIVGAVATRKSKDQIEKIDGLDSEELIQE